jgi:hypothetical protein
MDEREREELALDIARRVRLVCVQEAPKELLDALQPGSRYQHPLYTNGPQQVVVEYEVRADALHITFTMNGSYRMLHLRLDTPSPALAELQRST